MINSENCLVLFQLLLNWNNFLTFGRDNPYLTLNISVAKVCRFLLWIEANQSIFRNHLLIFCYCKPASIIFHVITYAINLDIQYTAMIHRDEKAMAICEMKHKLISIRYFGLLMKLMILNKDFVSGFFLQYHPGLHWNLDYNLP